MGGEGQCPKSQILLLCGQDIVARTRLTSITLAVLLNTLNLASFFPEQFTHYKSNHISTDSRNIVRINGDKASRGFDLQKNMP